jgi:aromatic-amino-acid transaminase
MKYMTLADHAVREHAPDKIFAASQKAKADIANLGEDAVINSTLGECLDDDGKLMVLPTVEKLLRSMPVEEMCSYAPIAGIPGFNEAVQISLFGKVSDRFHVQSVSTPGGCGALRHAIWNFLDDGDSMLTTEWVWGPYRNICEEHGRHMETFSMFNENDTFYIEAMDEAVGKILEKQKQLLLVLNTPANNPTGYSMTKEEMDEVVAVIRKYAAIYPEKRLTLCLDVSYIDFDDTFENTRRIFDSIHDMPENSMVLVVFSMSKSYTMCGMRCGALVALAETEEAAAEFKAAMSYSSRSVWSNVIRMAQRVLVDINTNPELKAQVDSERAVFSSLITKRGETFYNRAKEIGLKCCPYKHGYFVAIPCEHPGKAAEYLAEKHVYVVPLPKGLRFSPCAVNTEKCLRAPELIKEAIERTRE